MLDELEETWTPSLEVFVTLNGVSDGFQVLRDRSGSWFDPELVRAVGELEKDSELWKFIEQDRVREAVMEMEPISVSLYADEAKLDNVCEAFASVIDIKSPYTHSHSRGVTSIAVAICQRLALPEDQVTQVRRAALLHDIGKPVTYSFDEVDQRIRFNGHDQVGADMAVEIMTRFRFSNEEIDMVVEAIRNHMVFKDTPNMRPAKLRRFMGRQNFPLELELHRVDCLGSHGDLQTYDLLVNKQKEFENEPIIPPPLVTGRDLIALGLKPGPRFGEILEAVQTAQLDGEIKDRGGALRLLQTLEPSILASGIEKLDR